MSKLRAEWDRIAVIRAGASPKTVQTVLGHSSAAFTLTVCGHIFDADLDHLADRPEILGRGW